MKLKALRSRCVAKLSAFVAWLALAAVFAGCSGASGAPDPMPTPTLVPPPTVTPVPDSAAFRATAASSKAPDFVFRLFQGGEALGAEELRLSDLHGKPVALNFWARLCTPCWSEMPELQDFYEEYRERVTLLGIDVGQFTGLGSPKDASKLLDTLGISYPAGYTHDASVVRNYQIRAMPTTVFITGKGDVFRTWTGSITREQITAIVQRMLEKESGERVR